ncbi:hypothetical protein [Clostridium sp.]|uniref:hypothetical protein n=1 Tax=Clostridium sp. TaxID=1506 RepID=UPI001A4C0664|nr:hypothetical protein [Clostridium sp.]MBK5240559.1 hypothetical protein [Clostridium sp.]
MSLKNTPYPFDGMPDEDYYGELGTLSDNIGHFERHDIKPTNKVTDPNDTSERNPKDTFSEF